MPQVVAAVHSPGALRRAEKIRPGEVDFLEIRVDNFAPESRSAPAKCCRGCACR